MHAGLLGARDRMAPDKGHPLRDNRLGRPDDAFLGAADIRDQGAPLEVGGDRLEQDRYAAHGRREDDQVGVGDGRGRIREDGVAGLAPQGDLSRGRGSIEALHRARQLFSLEIEGDGAADEAQTEDRHLGEEFAHHAVPIC